ncbi:MAG: ribosome biogenesis GTPase Der [Candidatus Margulisbacteria bacterium]|nr:ribosome biogenesis GTPase Der [Candidatus Margulisiibacteriota bacterium]
MSIPTFLIVGRPNVGKSTLFNRLTGSKKSIVFDYPGVTRDLIFSYGHWENHNYLLVDSGGVFFDKTLDTDTVPSHLKDFQQIIEHKVKQAVVESDLIFFLVDARDGLTPYDKVISSYLQPWKNKVLLVVNKTDLTRTDSENATFYECGFETLLNVSATTSKGMDDLLEIAFKTLPDYNQGLNKLDNDNAIKVAIVGRPNVGKSSMINAILGQEKTIVSEIPGTTRDSTDHLKKHNKENYLFIDTAGLKKKSKNAKDIDFYSYIRTLRSLYECDIALLILDASEKITDQDKHIASLIEENRKCLLIIVNKWDLVPKESTITEKYTEYIYHQLQFIQYAPILYISAITKKRLDNIYEKIKTIFTESKKKIPQKQLNEFIKRYIKYSKNPAINSGRGKIYFIKQDKVKPFELNLYVNKSTYFNSAIIRHFITNFRKQFGFSGCPLSVQVKAVKDKKTRV